MRGGQQRDRGREEGEAPGGGVEGHHIIRGTRRDIHVRGEEATACPPFTMMTRRTARTSTRTSADVLRRCYLAR